MIPILYDYDEWLFAYNGLGRLRDIISCTVTEERNGIYECDFEYPVTGQNFNKIRCGRIVGVTHDDTDDIEPFDIISHSKPINGIVTFHCVHISYRQTKMVVVNSNINSLADAFTAFDTCYPTNPLGLLDGGNPFTYETDKTSTGYIAAFDGVPKSIRSILGGTEGSILDVYGGEYEWNNWTVYLHASRGKTRDFTIRYGVNMKDYQDDTDYQESFTSCVAYWTDGNGTTVTTGEIDSGQNSIFQGNRCAPLDLSSRFDSQPSVSDLEEEARKYMTANQSYLPTQNIKVDFVRLQDAEEYESFSQLLQCSLCDTIRVVFPMYGMKGQFKIVKTVWNVLQDKYDSMELGALSVTLKEALGLK